MWARHVLIGIVTISGISIVGSQLSRQQLEVDPSEPLQSQRYHDEVTKITVEAVNAEFASHLKQLSLETADRADNLLVARRLSLALVGTIPSLEEIRALESIEPDQQIPWWTNRLLADRRYSDYVGERLARAFVGTEGGPFIVFRRRRFVSWLSDCLLENKPYDEIVRELISDRGLWTDLPSVNFVTVTVGSAEKDQPDEERLAARTTRAFLGVRLDCMQCHDDNLDGNWRQSDFQQLAAFYAGARNSGLGIRDTDREYEFKYLGNENEEIVPPKVPFHDDLLEKNGTNRQQLAHWVTHPQNKAFARATVNRIWALLFGRPLVEPIDNISLEGPYPPGLEALADDFANHGFDLRRLITQITATAAFQRSSRASFDILSGHEEQFAVFPLTRLRPEQVAGSIVQSARLPTIDSNSHILVRLGRFEEVRDFVERYGDTGEDEFESHGGTIPQRLVMLNGKLVRERTKDDLVANAATRIAQQVRANDQAIDLAFLVVLTRRPSAVELEHFVSLFKDTTVQRNRQLEDIFWSLLNSTEFSWNH